MKVGIFGGTFDPIHIGHLIAAEEARCVLGLDQVLFIPAGRPWFKAGQRITQAGHRMAMVQRAVASNPWFKASDIEVRRPGPTYTVDTLVELRQSLGCDVDLYVILGLDALKEMHRWREPGRIFEMATVVGISRPGTPNFDPGVLDGISPGVSAKVVLINGVRIDISGTELRRRVAQGRSIRYWVPDAVEAYIHEHGLYRP